MKLHIIIDLDNKALKGKKRNIEVSNILIDYIERIRSNPGLMVHLFDSLGKSVGYATQSDEKFPPAEDIL